MRSKFLYLLLPLILVSCATPEPFTQTIRTKYKLTSEELQSLQFYTSSTIILYRLESAKTKTTVEGALTLKDKSEVKEIEIPANTPCVVAEVLDGNKVRMDFGEGKTLVFGSKKKLSGLYTLMALEWKHGRGKIVIDEEEYYTQPGAEDVYLMLEVTGLREHKKTRTVVGGQTISE